MLRVKRQNTLRPLQQIGQQESENTEAEQCRCVLGPRLFDVFTNAGYFIREQFDPPQDGMHERALTFEHPRHVCTQRLCADQDQPQKYPDLQNSYASHGPLLRTSPDGEERK